MPDHIGLYVTDKHANGLALYWSMVHDGKEVRFGVILKRCGHFCYRLEVKSGTKCCQCGPGEIKRYREIRKALRACYACGGTAKFAAANCSY